MAGEAGQASVEDIGVSIEKSYEDIYLRKEARLAKEALQEKRATMLTKHFMKLREEAEQEQLEKDAHRSKDNYMRSMAKLRENSEAQSLLVQMVREEKSQIFELMQDKGRQRMDEEKEVKERQAEVARMVKGRTLFEKQKAEEREKGMRQREAERLEKIEERAKRHEEALKSVSDTKVEAEKEALVKKQAVLDKVIEKRKKGLVELRQAKVEYESKLEQKAAEAEQRRRERQEEVMQTARDAATKRQQKVDESKRKQDLQAQEKMKKLAEKVEAFRTRTEASQQSQIDSASHRHRVEPPSDPEQQGSATAGRTDEQFRESGEKEEKKAGGSPRITHWSPELRLAVHRAHKDYVKKCLDLEQVNDKAHLTKKFKPLTDLAKEQGGSGEDLCTARMRSLHNMYIAKTPREPRASSNRSSPRSPKGKSGSPHAPKKLTCGYCERLFPLESLTGNALRRTVDRLKHQSPGGPKYGRQKQQERMLHERSGHAASSEATSTEQVQASTERPSTDKDSRLYDYEVRLCTSCFHFVRISST